MTGPRIALIHATPLAIKPVSDVFEQLWPEAKCKNLLDDSLPSDLQAHGMGPPMIERMVGLASYMEKQGAEAILFTCSAFGPAIEAAKNAQSISVLKPNEAMFDDALDLCARLGKPCRIGLLTTFSPSTASMLKELETAIELRGLPITTEGGCAAGAMEILLAGDVQTHDRMVLLAAMQMPACDVYLIGQFSMAHTQKQLEQVLHKPVLTSPASAIRRLQTALARH